MVVVVIHSKSKCQCQNLHFLQWREKSANVRPAPDRSGPRTTCDNKNNAEPLLLFNLRRGWHSQVGTRTPPPWTILCSGADGYGRSWGWVPGPAEGCWNAETCRCWEFESGVRRWKHCSILFLLLLLSSSSLLLQWKLKPKHLPFILLNLHSSLNTKRIILFLL